jgi:hypothetical protein
MTTECPKWPRAGARILDTTTGHAGGVQRLQSDDRDVPTGRVRPARSIRRSWQAERIRPRPVDASRAGHRADRDGLCAGRS